MKYSVKKKMINGELLYGVIDEDLKIVLPFEYSNIEEKTHKINGNGCTYTLYDFVISDKNGQKGIYIIEGSKYTDNATPLFIKPAYDYIEYVLNANDRPFIYRSPKFIIGQKNYNDMQYGVMEIYKLGEPSIVYPLGKVDEIKCENNEIVLYKHNGNNTFRGVFVGQCQHSEYGNFEPEYTQLELEAFEEVNYSNFGKIRIIRVAKLNDDKEVKGFYTRHRVSEYDEKWVEFLPCKYSDYNIDLNHHLVYVSKSKNNIELKGVVGFKDSHYTHGYGSYKFHSIYPEFTIPCEYEEIKFLSQEENKGNDWYIKYFLVKKDGKWGLIEVTRYKVNDRNIGEVWRTDVKSALECEYDSIKQFRDSRDTFVVTKNGKDGVFFNNLNGKNERILTDCEYQDIKRVNERRYMSIDSLETVYSVSDSNNKKSAFILNYNCGERYEQGFYYIKMTDFNYDEFAILTQEHYHRFIKMLLARKTVDGNAKYDLFNLAYSKGELMISDIDQIRYNGKYNLYETYTKIDEDTTRLTLVGPKGNILIDVYGKDLSYEYDGFLESFIVKNGGLIQVINISEHRDYIGTIERSGLDVQGTYSTFDSINALEDYSGSGKYHGIIRYRKYSPEGNNKLGLFKYKKQGERLQLDTFLQEEYESIEVVCDNKRSIVSKTVEFENPVIRYGVIENNQGKECISLEYDSITIGQDEDGNKVFVATKTANGASQQYIFDTDGFIIEDNTVGSNSNKKLVLTNNSRS